ncbi:hypothetical protein [Tenacibaculum finnmarkense]|uniref:DoxX family protein n=1 Tax=Tenacibaculum finnmarkense TaxID=2781243 RepID=UPI001D1C5D4C|nr:hypothetical protein [Tenacibaculum finnmarkense]MBE7688629.1 hypothetical protein [Tenacibaculum finnmarkense genomovar ulcerans]MCD8423151.1 hypothetical protein [Tenacibaculum finnmarkense genomovar ulcerans]MCD8432729.1 hypothetical protein [Tenacibaculum finnmarkense genomovar ulcerans]MCG8734286.1 hypothetical protein [Tenacibaculum finnmarkense]MCG8749765.1 hypothetical protein [Tenacibaculum finnmarkense]
MTKKNRFWNVLKIILAVFMIFGGVQHFIKPTFYLAFVPTFLPFPIMIIYLSGILEIGLGILLFLNTKYAKLGALGVFYLMLLFLPVHIWDVFSATPAIGSHTAALIRLPFQFLFIAWAWKIHKEISSSIAIKNN